jgi:GDP-L-fucose synthase
MNKPKIFIAGHKGMVGSALLRQLKSQESEILTRDRKELDLLNQQDVQNFFKYEKIDQVYLAAAKVGGIYANSTYPAEFIYENLTIQNNIIHNAFLNGVKKLLFLGSSCIYPKKANQPMNEDELLGGKLEPTNEPYAIAKIAGIKMCESYNRQYSVSHGIDYRSVLPTNLYGPGDYYHLENSHVIPSLILKFHTAKIKKKKRVVIWGTGKPKREFLFVDDLAKACVYIMSLDRKKYSQITHSKNGHINIGYGEDLTINDLALKIKKVVNYKGTIEYDKTKPDGMISKLLNSYKINSLGWKPEISLDVGLIKTYSDFLKKK